MGNQQGKIKDGILNLLPYFQTLQKLYNSANCLLVVIKKLNNFKLSIFLLKHNL